MARRAAFRQCRATHRSRATPLFNSYIRGRHRPSPEILEKICCIFEEPERAALVKAHLEDETPPCASSLIYIQLNIDSPITHESTDESELFHGLAIKVAEAIRYMIKRAREEGEFQDWLLKTVAFIREE